MIAVPSLGDFSIGWRMQRRLLTGYRAILLIFNTESLLRPRCYEMEHGIRSAPRRTRIGASAGIIGITPSDAAIRGKERVRLNGWQRGAISPVSSSPANRGAIPGKIVISGLQDQCRSSNRRREIKPKSHGSAGAGCRAERPGRTGSALVSSQRRRNYRSRNARATWSNSGLVR